MLLRSSFRFPVVLASLVGLAACAHGSGSGGALPAERLSERPAPRGRQCGLANQPAALPAASALVDSAALTDALRELRTKHPPVSGYAILTLAFDENGWNALREVVEHDVPPEVADTLQKLVFEHRRTVTPGAPWGVRLRIDLAEAPRFRVGRQELCAPRALSYPSVGSPLNPWDRSTQLITMTHQNSVWARVLVDEQGRVTSARLEQAGVDQRWESFLIGMIQSMQFAPATVDGIPFAAWSRVRIPLQGW